MRIKTLSGTYQQKGINLQEHSKIFEKIDNQPILRIVQDRINIWYATQKTFRIIFPTVEEWERTSNLVEKENLVLYTDQWKTTRYGCMYI